jgi:hypothetical protein
VHVLHTTVWEVRLQQLLLLLQQGCLAVCCCFQLLLQQLLPWLRLLLRCIRQQVTQL